MQATTTTNATEQTCRLCGRLAGPLGTDGNGACYACRTIADANIADMLHEQTTFGPTFAMSHLDDATRRRLQDRIEATRYQIAAIERKQYETHCYSERTMVYGIRHLESHIATLRWQLAAI